eukprot:3340570-Amphidinium_carterae.1
MDDTERERRPREKHLANVKEGFSLAFAKVPKRYRADQEIVLTAVTRDGSALQYAAKECKADHEIVLTAVTQNGSALQYAAEECKAEGGG